MHEWPTLPRRGGPQTARAALAAAIAVALPVALAAAWIPVRTRFPNTDLALVLVLAVGVVGALGRRVPVFVAGVSAAFWFEFFDTVPYDRLAIARSPDIETTLVLAVAGVIVGELGLWTVRHRQALQSEAEQLSSVRAAAELVASGEELVVVIDAVAAELGRLLGLAGCRFEAPDAPAPAASVTRDGRITRRERLVRAEIAGRLSAGLDVVVQQQVLGRFVLDAGDRARLSRERLLVAVTLADQVAGAFLAQAPPPLPPGTPEPERGLHVVAAHRGHDGGPAAAQETAGFPSAADRMIS